MLEEEVNAIEDICEYVYVNVELLSMFHNKK